jgi:NAD(P)-dependent dehydrogenase (short-subunit alcohol dehydrogenase family)
MAPVTPQERVILVTGGTGALGRQVTAFFVAEGGHVHATWIDRAEVEDARRDLGARLDGVVLHECDVTSEADVGDAFEAVERASGPVTVLANVVGGYAGAPIEATDVPLWRKMIDLNATSAFICCRAAIPRMKEQRWGRIINVAAVPVFTGAGGNMSAYSAAKAAVWSLTHSLAAELRGSGVTCNAVVPTTIDTPANRRAMPGADRASWITPADIAAVMGFLASDAAAVVTGSALRLAARG